MTLRLRQQRITQIQAYGEESYPHECCGFLIGTASEALKQATLLLPASNEFVDEEKYHRFLITPEAYLRGEKYARERNLDIVGFYHSHPNAEARPSPYDLEHAWPWYSYVIVSVKDAGADSVNSWVLRDDRSGFDQEQMVIE